ncbi:uncharacterized protein LOC116343089 [Contarinia nasturtii]|uniref:uncharacterized protein LOC116343089 n=1 Tax=Contarinia nasturtii TaxID=265458 RepID=UPI0012D3BB20|nr:uncharacterized protein LOC116343089 [Contarinia nasturtii]
MKAINIVSLALCTLCVLADIKVPKINSTTLILGGKNAKEGQFPYQVSLRYQGFHFCDGSIINNSKQIPGVQPFTLDNLYFIGAEIFDLENCARIFRENLIPKVTESNICISSPKAVGVCMGDSGGPLVDARDPKNKVLVGIISWSIPCGTKYPDVFTRVYSYASWIESVMAKHVPKPTEAPPTEVASTEAPTREPPIITQFRCNEKVAIIEWEARGKNIKYYTIQKKSSKEYWWTTAADYIKYTHHKISQPEKGFTFRVIAKYIDGKSSQPSEPTTNCPFKPNSAGLIRMSPVLLFVYAILFI